MPLLVTMHVFSGVPDPQWVISGDNEKELRRLISTPAAAAATPAHEGVLGYRGFSVVDTNAGAQTPLFQVQSAASPAGSHSIAGAQEVEHFLLWTGHDHVPDVALTHADQAIQANLAPLAAAPPAHCPPCRAHDAPPYNPALWNHPPVQGGNNCYNYANDQITNTFAQPGRATGHMYPSPPACAGVRAGAQSDGLAPCANFTAPLAAGHGWYVALVIWPGQDYHWYRQDNTGCWSHKPGGTPARNTDNAGHQILDPRTCNRGPYTVFCSYMVTKRTVHIH